MESHRTSPGLAARATGACIVAVVCAAMVASVTAQTTAEEAAATLALVPHATPFVREGAILYDHACSACHGDTGGGLEEARLSFPEGERRCASCHKPTNPPQMDHQAMTHRNAFDVGEAPPLLGDEADLTKYATGSGLFGYVRATMPRPFPASLTDDEYAAITAFLAVADGAAPADGLGGRDDLAAVELR